MAYTSPRYLLNTSDTHETQLLDGKVRVPAGGWAEITEAQSESEEVQDCVRRNWVKLETKKPSGKSDPDPTPVVAETPAVVGLTEPPKKKQTSPEAKETKLG